MLVAQWPLAEGEYRLGRSSRNDFDLDAEGVSREHARITVEAGAVFIEDLGSRYGTMCEGKAISGRCEMKPGREIRIGKLSLEVREVTPKPNLPAATLPTENELAALAARAAGKRPLPQPKVRDVIATAKDGPSLLRRAVPFIVNLAIAAGAIAIVLHFRNEREAAAKDRAIAESERAEAAAHTARLRTKSATTAPQPARAETATVPNDSAQLRPFTSQQAWNANRIRRLEDGTLRINLSTLYVADLSPLRGLPVTELDLSNCLLRALPDISFLTLRRLSIRDTAITSLAPLARHPLRELHLEGTPAVDLTPLRDLPLESLTLDERISDLSALRGLPLRELDLRNHTRIRDFRPLLECRRLDILYVPENAEIDCLRAHPSLKFIAIRDPHSAKPNAVDGPTAAHYFWQKYGALMRQRAAR